MEKQRNSPIPCQRCGDTYRFDDQGISVCSTCGIERREHDPNRLRNQLRHLGYRVAQ